MCIKRNLILGTNINNMSVLLFTMVFVLMTFLSCRDDKPHSPLLIKNLSSKTISVYLTLSPPYYPDTSITSDQNFLREIPESSSTTYFTGRVDWEGIYAESENGILSVFYFDQDTINLYPWDSIREHYKVLRRDDFSLDDLMEREFIISYP